MTTNNSKLSIAYWLMWFVGYGSFTLAAIFLLLGIHLSISPEYYETLKLSSTMFSFEVVNNETVITNLGDQAKWKIWLTILQGVSIFICIGFMGIYGKRILQNVREEMVFVADNSALFRKIGTGFLVLTALSFFDVSLTGSHQTISANLSIGYIMAALFAYILAEIFQEGNRLDEEAKHTV